MSETTATDAAAGLDPGWLGLGLALLGAAAGLLVHAGITMGGAAAPTQAGAALATFAVFAAGAFALILDPARWREQAIFALALGLLEAALAYRLAATGRPGGDFAPAAALALGLIAVPLFQSGAHRLGRRIDPATAHRYAWTDAILGAGSLAFLGASWIAATVVASLFHLLRIDVVRHLLDQQWFDFAFSGTALGAALAALRDQRGIVATLQLVVMTVLSLLAPPLAAVLVVFLGALVVSGPDVLWAATRSATPVLMGSAIGAFLLACAVLRDADADLPKSRVLRIGGLVLALGVLPLAAFAAVSMATRIAQHGLSPERLWALVAIALALAWGIAWWVAALRGRLTGWPAAARRANTDMAFVAMVTALVVAAPLSDFGAISTRQQVARLQRGAVTPEAFDYAALRWTFGPAGKAALRRLESSANPQIAALAHAAVSAKNRWSPLDETFSGQLVVLPAGAAIPPALLAAIKQDPGNGCSGPSVCRVFLQADGITAVVIDDNCARPGMRPAAMTSLQNRCRIGLSTFRAGKDGWQEALGAPEPQMTPDEERRSIERERAAIERGDVVIRPAPLEQIYIGGKPTGSTFAPRAQPSLAAEPRSR